MCCLRGTGKHMSTSPFSCPTPTQSWSQGARTVDEPEEPGGTEGARPSFRGEEKG